MLAPSWIIRTRHPVLDLDPEPSMSPKQLVAWLAWPIISYAVGHYNGKEEVQRQLDAIYEEAARERQRRSGEM